MAPYAIPRPQGHAYDAGSPGGRIARLRTATTSSALMRGVLLHCLLVVVHVGDHRSLVANTRLRGASESHVREGREEQGDKVAAAKLRRAAKQGRR